MPLDTTTPDTYSAPTSSPDPYDTIQSSSSITPTTPLPTSIDINALPHGLPILGPLTGYTPTNLARILQSRIAYLSQTLSRPLSDTELTAIAHHTAKGHAIASWGPSLGIAAALYRIRATRAEFRWPFYGKLMSEEVGTGFWDGEKMRVGGKEILKGVPVGVKANMLHFLRGSAYITIGVLVVPAAVSAYGATVSAVGEIRDQRLGAVTQELRVMADKELRERSERRGERREERIGQTTGQGRTDAGVLFRERRERLQGKKREEDDDDMSPTGGGVGFADDDEQGRLGAVRDMGGVLSDGQMKEREVKAQPEKRREMDGASRQATFQLDKVERQPSNFGEDFDDASPTGGSGGDGGGSVWERIRQQSASGSTSSPVGKGSSGRGGEKEAGDSFSFSSSEGEQNYARDEAQKEFDERVEKERRGGNFSGEGGSGGDGGGSNRRW